MLTEQQAKYLAHDEYRIRLSDIDAIRWRDVAPGLVEQGLVKMVEVPMLTKTGDAALAEYAREKRGPKAKMLRTSDGCITAYWCPMCDSLYSLWPGPETTADIARVCSADCTRWVQAGEVRGCRRCEMR